MNRDDVIKALKCCSDERDLCAECPVDKRLLDECVCGSFVMGQALQLIGSLEQVIFELENRLKECENGYSQTLAIERAKVKELTEENKMLRLLRADDGLAVVDYAVNSIRAMKFNTARKMQEALKERIKGVYLDEGEMCAIIDEVAEKILKGNTEEEKK